MPLSISMPNMMMRAHDNSMHKTDGAVAAQGRAMKLLLPILETYLEDEVRRDSSFNDLATGMSAALCEIFALVNIAVCDPNKEHLMIETAPESAAACIRLIMLGYSSAKNERAKTARQF